VQTQTLNKTGHEAANVKKHPCHAQMDNNEECVKEIRAFASGGTAGLYRLKQVLSSLFGYYNMQTRGEQMDALRKVGLDPIDTGTGVSFTFNSEMDSLVVKDEGAQSVVYAAIYPEPPGPL